MAVPAQFKFKNMLTGIWAPIDDALISAFTAPINPSLVAAIANSGVFVTAMTGNTTIFVSTTGNDANDGLTPATPKLTLQNAYDTIRKYYFNGFTGTISVADGTYTAGIITSSNFLGGNLFIVGTSQVGTILQLPVASVATDIFKFATPLPNNILIKNFTLTSATSSGSTQHGIYGFGGGNIFFYNVTFGVFGAGGIAFRAEAGTTIAPVNNYAITGSCRIHMLAGIQGVLNFALGASSPDGGGIVGFTVALTGAINFAAEFCSSTRLGIIQCGSFSNSFDVSAAIPTGIRFNADSNGVVYTQGSGATFFPGSIAGTTATGGQYI